MLAETSDFARPAEHSFGWRDSIVGDAVAVPAGSAFGWDFAVLATAAVGSPAHGFSAVVGTLSALEAGCWSQTMIGYAAACAAAVLEGVAGTVEFAALVAVAATGRSSAEAPAVEASQWQSCNLDRLDLHAGSGTADCNLLEPAELKHPCHHPDDCLEVAVASAGSVESCSVVPGCYRQLAQSPVALLPPELLVEFEPRRRQSRQAAQCLDC